MGSDLFALSALADELNEKLTGAKIDKITQPEADEVRFFLRGEGKNLCLVLSCNAGAPRLHLTKSKKQNPMTAPALCMLLRKYLSVSMIEGVSIYNADRIIRIKFNARTEMKDNAVLYVFVEIMNRYSNIVFTDENGIILDAVKHLPFDIARSHVVLRGIKYEPVAQGKISFLTAPISIFDNFEGGDLHKYILDNMSGFSGITVSELLHRAGLSPECPELSKEDKSKLLKTLEIFRNVRSQPIYSPCLTGKKEVYPFPYAILCSKESELFDSMSDAYDALFSVSDTELRNKNRLKDLLTASKRLRNKAEKNINIDNERLAECETMEEWRIKGELIVSNIYKIKRGDHFVDCYDYYAEKDVRIPLDELLTPSKNSAAYFNRYNKLKRTKEFTEKKLIEDRLLLDYAISIEKELESLPYEASSAAIEEELTTLGMIRGAKKKGKVRKEKSEPPYSYEAYGFTILRGKNNLQNDELTFKTASSSDIWLHLKNDHGSHTIILAGGKPVPDKVLTIAAEITASTKSASADVDYTMRRNVKRQPNGHPGQVIYTDFKTILAKPDEHNELLKSH